MHRAAWLSLLACLVLLGLGAMRAPAADPETPRTPCIAILPSSAEAEPFLIPAVVLDGDTWTEPGTDGDAPPPFAPPAALFPQRLFPPPGAAHRCGRDKNLPTARLLAACSIRGPPMDR